MFFIRNTILPFLFVSLTVAAFGQLGVNFKPQIVGQLPLSTNENVPITIELRDLVVLDVGDVYPFGFSLKLYEGKDYDFEGRTVTPHKNFHGKLTVPITVNDGKDDSKKFELKITVNQADNIKPVITGQVPLPLTATSGEKITIELSHLTVADADNTYPQDFTLKVSSGENYDRDDNTITPDGNFVGMLNVPVTVHDGEDESAKYNLKVEVVAPSSAPPVITGQDGLTTNEDQSIIIQLDNLEVTDPDSKYPKGFTLNIPQGNGTNYSVSGNTITPTQNFSGTLNVTGVTVNDGRNESNAITLRITVKPVNDAPVITGQDVLTTQINTPIAIALENLDVTDPDNPYPNGFTLKIEPGFTYTVADNTITPSRNFEGTLMAKISVNDGSAKSNSFELHVRVMAVANVAPIITGQKPDPVPLTVNNKLKIELSHLLVTDPDNLDYPVGFTLTVSNGTNYTVSGTTITPALNFTGTLQVKVSVNDGTASSNTFNLKIAVVPVTAIPQIIGQKALMIDEDESLTIELDDLFVSDGDDTYPVGFTLQVLPDPGRHYQVNKSTITPAKNLNGFLTVGVTVTDADKNTSNPFNLAILINPVNDPPVITKFETSPLSYEPGTDPLTLTSIFEVEDVDNDHLSFAEIDLDSNYSKGFDELLFTNTDNIHGVFDVETGNLSLIGYGTLDEYTEAIRSVTYNYRLSEDENGAQTPILPGAKTILLRVHDGQQMSETRSRNIIMEVTVSLNIPTAFTPNGDGPNDTWNIHALTNAQQCDDAIISVYNKRGLLLFRSTGLEKKWDGRFNGEILPTDTYYYTIDLNLAYSKKTYKGVVTILR